MTGPKPAASLAGRPHVIAIDGPAASGKSSVARRVAAALGWAYVNTGAMYRAVTARIIQDGIDPANTDAVRTAAMTYEVDLVPKPNEDATVTVNGVPVPADVLTADATNRGVSLIAGIPEIRARLVARQRALAIKGNAVLEGRDTGSVVCPEAPLKIYLSANESIRQARREAQGILDKVGDRDKIDSQRSDSPLMIPPGAVVIDSTDLSLSQVVDRILGLAGSTFPKPPPERPDWLYRTAQAVSRLYFRAFHPTEILGLENLPTRGPALLIANHTSFFDPPVIGCHIPGPISYMARKSLFDVPLLGGIIRRLQCIPVDQDRADGSSLKVVLRYLSQDRRVLIFPEGKRTFDGKLSTFEPGTGFLVAKAKVPVIPILITGAFEALPRGARLPSPGTRIQVRFGQPWYYRKEDFPGAGRELYDNIAIRLRELLEKMEA